MWVLFVFFQKKKEALQDMNSAGRKTNQGWKSLDWLLKLQLHMVWVQTGHKDAEKQVKSEFSGGIESKTKILKEYTPRRKRNNYTQKIHVLGSLDSKFVHFKLTKSFSRNFIKAILIFFSDGIFICLFSSTKFRWKNFIFSVDLQTMSASQSLKKFSLFG